MPTNIPDLDQDAKKPTPKWPIIAFAIGTCTLLIGIFILLGLQYFSSNKTGGGTLNSIVNTGTAISGVVDINGPIPANATITISQKQLGQENFTTALKNIDAINGAEWNWGDASSGKEYEVKASIQSGGITLATSKSVVVIAPASGEVLKLSLPNKSTNDGNAAISGELNLNGYIPPNSTINILARLQGSSSFKTVLNNVSAVDQGVWNWTSAEEGSTYEMQAVLNGSSTNSSEIQQITAPATNEVFTINSTLNPPSQTTVGISGSFNINGTVPNNAFISLATRVTGTTQFNQVATNLPTANGTTWSWNAAQSGTSYDIQAYIWSSGTPYTSSQIITITAPANNEVITLNAMTPPSNTPPSNSISVSCNGSNPANGLWAVNVSYNNNNAITNAQQFNLTIGNTGGGNQFVNNTTAPSNPNQSQSYSSAYVFNAGQTYYAQYAYATCQNCNTFSNYSPSIQFSCSTPYASPTPTLTPTNAPTNTPVPTNTPPASLN